MKNNPFLIITLFCSLFLSSCISSIDYINNISKNGSLINGSQKQIIIIGSGEVNIDSFEKTYTKNFDNDDHFKNSYLTDFINASKENDLYNNITVSENQEWDLLNQGYNSSNNIKLDTLFNNAQEDYLIHFSDFRITNRVVHSYSHGFGPGAMMNNNSTEFCVVNLNVTIYDLKAKKEILSFVSTGESSVFMFDFTKTFLKAKERSIKHIINYLKDGKTTYRSL